MKLHQPESEIFIPDGTAEDAALARTTHLAVGAHQDDLEIFAFHGILSCFQQSDQHFGGVVVTNGSGSPRDGVYGQYSDEDMVRVRRQEQKKAAVLGEYGFLGLLMYPSSAVKDGTNPDVVGDLTAIFRAARPRVVYTHNLADKHDTHVAVALRVIAALRALPAEERPEQVLGCEVWTDLDWLNDADKVALDVGPHENLQAALLGVHDSQIAGGKRYDLATLGRRKAHATFYASHGLDETTGLIFAMDLTPLVQDASLEPLEHYRAHLRSFEAEVAARIGKMS